MRKRIPDTHVIYLALILLLYPLTCSGHQPGAKTLFPVERDNKWGFIDRSGQIVIPLQFEDASDFHEGLALATAKGKRVFIDATGQIVLRPNFDIVNTFSEGLAAVNTGKLLFEVQLDVTLGFHEGIVGILWKGLVTYYDRIGKKLPISTAYGPKSNSFSEGLVPIETKSKWGFVDKTGKLAIAAQFEDADNFSEGLAPIKIGGETIWCPPDATGSRLGFTMRWGYIDRAGKLVIPPQFESAAPFSEGLAAIHNCDQAYFIDKTGKTVISGNFRYVSSFSGGLAQIQTMTTDGLLSGYVDKSGTLVWGPAK